MKNNQIGIIGLGYWGTNIVNVLEKLNIKRIYCYDISRENLREIKKKFPYITIFKKLDDLLNIKLDGIVISVSTKFHYEISKKCLLKGHNIFVEKPVTNSSKKLIKLHRLAKLKKKIIMSGYIYYYNNYIDYIKKKLKKNLLGKIKYISFERLNLGPVRSDISSAWDLASHDISIFFYLFEKNLKILKSSGYDILKKKVEDINVISARMDNVKIDIKSSWLNPEKIRKLVIIGQKKMLLFNEMDKKNPIKIYNKFASYPKIKKFKKGFFTPKANIYLGSTFCPKLKFSSPLEEEMKEFIKCINLNKKPKTSTAISLKVLKTLEKLN